jgi:hypothetical protein
VISIGKGIMVMRRIFIGMVLIVGWSKVVADGCMVTIVNDRQMNVFVVDLHGNAAVHLSPGKAASIKPTYGTHSRFKKFVKSMLFNKALDIYLQDDSGVYRRVYEIIEKDCSAYHNTVVSISKIECMIAQASNRFDIKKVNLKEASITLKSNKELVIKPTKVKNKKRSRS